MPHEPAGCGDLSQGLSADSHCPGGQRNLVDAALQVVLNLIEEYPVPQALDFLSRIEQTLAIIKSHEGVLRDLPPLSACAVDDGSILIEWVLSGCRLGLNIESDPNESSWYLVTDREHGSINASGLFFGVGVKLDFLLLWLFSLAASWSE